MFQRKDFDMDKKLIERAEEMRKQAEAMREEARELEEKASALRRKSRELENEAVALVVPFKVGDLIEYKTMQGIYEKKTVVRRMVIKSLHFSDGGIVANGAQANAKGEANWRNGASARFYTDYWPDEFLRVVSPASVPTL